MQAPTDNLYKFISISGLALFIYLQFDLERRSADLSNKIDEYVMSQYVLKAQIEGGDAVMKIIEARFGSIDFKEIKQDARIKEFDRLIELRERHIESAVDLAKLDATSEAISKNKDLLELIRRKYKIMSALSACLFFSGLFFWYYKTQRPMDNNIKMYDIKNHD